jgi:hypothetical protein
MSRWFFNQDRLLWPLWVLGSASVSVLMGCANAALLRPLCASGASGSELPDFTGDYQLTLQAVSELQKQEPESIDMDLTISRSQDGGQEIAIDIVSFSKVQQSLGSPLRMATFLACPLGKRTLLSSSSPSFFNLSDNHGVSSVSEVILHESGIQILPMAVDPEQARRSGLATALAPGFTLNATRDNGNSRVGWSREYGPLTLVVNDPEQPEKIVPALRRLSTSFFLRRKEQALLGQRNVPKRAVARIATSMSHGN